MAATKWLFYDYAKLTLLNEAYFNALDTVALRMHLFKNDASTTVSVFTASTLGQLTNTVNSSGYKGIKTLTPVLKAHSTSSAILSIGSVKFSASTIGDINSIMYAVIFQSISGSGRPLCFCRLSTGAFNVTTGNVLTIRNTSGVFTLSGGTTE